MKFLKTFFAAILVFSVAAASAQTNAHTYVKTTTGPLSEVSKISTLTTTDATATHIDSFIVADNTAGIVTVEVVGMAANGDGITGKKIVRYSKKAGTLTLGTPADILAVAADTGLSGGTFAVATTASGNFQIKVTGKASTTVKWRCKRL